MKPLIVALDVETEKEALGIIRETKSFADIYKVGPGLVLRYGPDIFKKIKRFHKKIFLDMKFHDIPSTVARSISETSQWNIFSVTVHLAAGEKALAQAVRLKKRPFLWGVTVLTSLSGTDLYKLGFRMNPLDQVLSLAGMAKQAGLDGVVASVGEAAQLRNLLGSRLKIITPGIRLHQEGIGDQIRVASPQHARLAGADYIVVGRPIIESQDPGLLAQNILKDWNKAKPRK